MQNMRGARAGRFGTFLSSTQVHLMMKTVINTSVAVIGAVVHRSVCAPPTRATLSLFFNGERFRIDSQGTQQLALEPHVADDSGAAPFTWI